MDVLAKMHGEKQNNTAMFATEDPYHAVCGKIFQENPEVYHFWNMPDDSKEWLDATAEVFIGHSGQCHCWVLLGNF